MGKCARCKGTIRKQHCTSSNGESIHIKGECETCGERRCRSHCKCSRTGRARGKKAPRPRIAAKAKLTVHGCSGRRRYSLNRQTVLPAVWRRRFRPATATAPAADCRKCVFCIRKPQEANSKPSSKPIEKPAISQGISVQLKKG